MRRLAGWLWIALLGTMLAAAAYGQGCSACRDTTAGSAPEVRRGLRKAIPVLAVPAAALFVGMLVVAARTQPGRR